MVAQARERWTRFPSITALREVIDEMTRSQGGVISHEDLISSVLAARGSTLEEPKRTQMASAAVRAALETERGFADPRYQEYRTNDRIFIAATPELKEYASQLGRAADDLADQEQLPSPASVIAALRAVPLPNLPENVTAPSDSRLCQLAVSASNHAALSSRLEIYPAHMPPERSLALCQNALFGVNLTVGEMQNRVFARYPKAAPLPERPKLDKLIQSLNLDLKWNPDAAGGKGAYEVPGSDLLTIVTSDSISTRRGTKGTALLPSEISPVVEEARSLEGKLAHAAKTGAFLVLSVPPGRLKQARQELVHRFPLEECDIDALFLSLMKKQAELSRADWRVVLKADAAPQESTDWKKLHVLVDRCLPAVRDALRSPDKTKLLVNPGLFARYDHMEVLAELAGDIGRTNGVHGVWILVPASDQNPLPTINERAIPMVTGNAAQHARINDAWLANKHRGG